MKDPDDLAMMRSPDNWPNWPYLPLKKRSTILGRMPELGILVARPEDKFQFARGANLWHLEEYDFSQVEDINPEDLVADGWVVD